MYVDGPAGVSTGAGRVPLPGFLDRLGFSFLQQHRGARKTSTVGTVEGRASSIPLAPAIIPQDEESALEER